MEAVLPPVLTIVLVVLLKTVKAHEEDCVLRWARVSGGTWEAAATAVAAAVVAAVAAAVAAVAAAAAGILNTRPYVAYTTSSGPFYGGINGR